MEPLNPLQGLGLPGFGPSGLNQRGQAFEAYKLLIGAILALLILLIILGAIQQLRGLEDKISHNKLVQAAQSARKQPNGQVLKVEDIVLKEGGYTNESFAEKMNLDPTCISLDSYGHAFAGSPPESVLVNYRVLASVFFRCEVANTQDCEVECEIKFGKGFD